MAEQDRPSNERKFSRREMLRLAGLGSVGLLVAGCGPASTPETAVEKAVETVVVKEEGETNVNATPPPKEAVNIFATSQMEVTFWQPSMERAKDMLPGINLEVSNTQITDIGWSGYSDLVITQIAGGQQLDVIMIAVEGLPLLSSKNILLPLDPLFDADTEAKNILMTDIHKTLREMLQYEGKQMEFPFSWNNMVMYYNTKIYEDKGIDPPKPEWTWDDFLENCLKVADVKGTADDLYAYSFWGGPMFGMCAWFYGNDTSPLTADWKDSNMLDPKMAETLQFLADLILKHKVAPNPTGWDEAGQFHAGHLAMRTCGRWCIAASLKEHFSAYDLQYQPHQSGPYRTVAGTDGWGIAAATRYPEEAWQTVKFLSSKEAALDMVALGGNIPALRSVAEMPEFKETGPVNTGIFYESLDYARTVASPPNFNIIEPILTRHYATIWNGEKTVEEVVQAAHTELQAEMDKLKGG